tara:strand:- start:327 stop:1367 length:1041 start_codon:yes stop_codon:yes gene_type:complete
MATFKRSYLPSQSQPWAKQVEDKVDATERSLKSLDVNNRSKDEQFSASLNRLDAAVIDARAASELADAAQIAATSANTTAIDANTLASTANTNALSAIADVVGLSSSGGTTINADNISGGTISGNFITGGTIDGVSITGGDLNTTPVPVGGLSVQVSGSSAVFKNGGASVGQISADAAGRLLVSGNSGLYLNAGAAGSTNFGSGGFTVGDSAPLATTGSLTRTSLNGGGTTGASITNGGNFVRTSSSQRYKTDIQLLDIDLSDLYSAEPKTFKRIEEVEENPETARTYPGFIAEDLAGTSLDSFVFYSNDEEGNPRPEGIHYPELTGALLIAIKDLNARIEALEAK